MLLLPASYKVIVASKGNILWPVIIIKNFNSINSKRPRPWPPILISHLFQHAFFRFLPITFLYQGVFWSGLVVNIMY